MATLLTTILFVVALVVITGQSLFQGDFAMAGMSGSALVVVTAFFMNMMHAANRTAVFAAWFDRHRDAIARGETVELGGRQVDEHTRIVRFNAVLSLVFATWQTSSPIYVRSFDGVVLPQILYSLFTALFGWWGFPHGIWRTPLAIAQNLLRYKSATLGDVATGLRPGVFPELEQRESEEARSARASWDQSADASVRTSSATVS